MLCDLVRQIQHRKDGGECTHSVVMAIRQYHTPVDAQIARSPGGNNLQICGEKILLLNPIGL